MSTKTSTAQPPGRRTPLSLNAAKQNNKQANDNSKKETNANNQKTENAKKDLAVERKPSTDRKQNTTSDSRKASTSDSKKPEEAKTAKNVDNKKNQNGVSANGVKNSNEGASKNKPDTSAASVPNTPKKEDDKATEKKDVAKETKNETNDKSKAEDKNKEKTPADSKKSDENKKEKDVIEQKKVDDKTAEEKSTPSKKTGDAAEKVGETINLDSSDEKKTTGRSPGRPRRNEDVGAAKTSGKGKKVEEAKKPQEKPVQPLAEELEDVVMMEPLAFDPEPPAEIFAASTPAKNLSRSGETTPKVSPKSEIKAPRATLTHTPDRNSCPRSFSSISGRRSIRPIGDYTFSGNLQIRESYRKINTELDFTSSSMNVTVGSEVPNNDSFSFFSRSRKRERQSPTYQSAMEVQADISPKSPKRARIDLGMSGFFNAMASPITMLRARLSRASVQSTPKKEPEVVEVVPIEEDIVENVSGISVEEETTATEDFTVNPDSTVDNLPTDGDDPKIEEPAEECSEKPAVDGLKHDDDIQIKEIITTTDSQAKKKCSIM